MSAVIKLRGTDVLNDVFIFYDFTQVADAVMVMLYAKKESHWQKELLYNNNNKWNTDILKQYFDEKDYETVDSKLKVIFDLRESPDIFNGIDFEKSVAAHSKFLLGVY